jgi:hypothetical protein
MARIGLPGLDLEGQKRLESRVERLGSATVDERGHGDDLSPRSLDQIDDFPYRSTRRDHVLDDEYARVFRDIE